MSSPRIIHLAETGSTMDEARRLASALADDARRGDDAAATSLREGVLITTEAQTDGRGTQGRAWHSPRGALMGTFFRQLPGAAASAISPPLTLRTALGIARLAEAWLVKTKAPPVRIKWPNDILLGDAKLAGVLIELVDLGDPGDGAPMRIGLIGVGLNANNPPPELPPGMRRAASLAEHRTSAIGLTDAAQQLARALASASDRADTPLTGEELESLNQRLHARGRTASVRAAAHPADSKSAATIDAINPDGTLRVLIDHEPYSVARTTDIQWPDDSNRTPRGCGGFG